MCYIIKRVPAITIKWYHELVMSRGHRAVPKLWSDHHNSHSAQKDIFLVAETKGILDLVAAEVGVRA